MIKPLSDILIVDFSQFLSGPCCTLRLADLGAEVIKIEKPQVGDICRKLYVSNINIDGSSTLFHAINRNKKSLTVNLKDSVGLAQVKNLLRVADVLVHNFRPGVMERLGLGYEEIKALNPAIVYASISGYGADGAWAKEPGQDLLLQAVSGLAWLSGNTDDGPVPMGVSVVDILAGTYLAQGILAALYKKSISGEGVSVQVNMLETAIDYQFEVLTCFLNNGNQLPERSVVNSTNAYLAAPYGIYKTSDGYIAMAMGDIVGIANLINCEALKKYTDKAEWFTKKDEIKLLLIHHFATNATAHWLSVLEPADIWCAEVLDYAALRKHEGYKVLDMEQEIETRSATKLITTRCPIKINGEVLKYTMGAPELGQHSDDIIQHYILE